MFAERRFENGEPQADVSFGIRKVGGMYPRLRFEVSGGWVVFFRGGCSWGGDWGDGELLFFLMGMGT